MRLKLYVLFSSAIFLFSCSGNEIKLDLSKVERHFYECDPGMDSINGEIYQAQEKSGVTCTFGEEEYKEGEMAELTLHNSTNKTIRLNRMDSRPDFIFGMQEHPLLVSEKPAAIANIMECETGEASVFIRFLNSKSCELNATEFIPLEIGANTSQTFSVTMPRSGKYRFFFNTVAAENETGGWGTSSIIYSKPVRVAGK